MFLELRGETFGRLTVVSREGGSKWNCECLCGNYTTVRSYNLKSGATKSCGCLSAELSAVRKLKHGHARLGRATPEYKAWAAAIERCTNPKKRNWNRYGGRGVAVCEEWLYSFEEFLAHVGLRPSSRHSLDRYPNNDGNYEPGNVRWATPEEQGRNTIATAFILISGEKICLTDAAAKYGISRSSIRRRLAKGWSPERAVGLS